VFRYRIVEKTAYFAVESKAPGGGIFAEPVFCQRRYFISRIVAWAAKADSGVSRRTGQIEVMADHFVLLIRRLGGYMRKFVAVMIVVMGMSIGMLIAYKESWGMRFVMMGLGLLFTAPIAGIVAGIGRKSRAPLKITPGFGLDVDYLPGQSMSPMDVASNYWRDEGHPPFAKPSSAPPDLHQFDPHNLG
jgi:hypothetical protein